MESKIKKYEDACKYLKRDPKALPEVKKLSKKEDFPFKTTIKMDNDRYEFT